MVSSSPHTSPPPPASPEAELIRTAQKRADYDQFAPILKDQIVLPEAKAILEDIGGWYTANPEALEIDWSTFLAWAKVSKRATWKPDKWSVYEGITHYASSLPSANPAIISRFQELTACSEIRTKIEALVRSSVPGGLEEIARIAELASGASKAGTAEEAITDNFEDLLKVVTREDGLEWRLEDLNRAIGPIDRGDVVYIGKRPEVGGTTFLASEFSYMAPQLPVGAHCAIFTNEEIGAKVKMRVIQAALGWTLADIAADPKAAKAKYEGLMKGRRIDVFHNTGMTSRYVERILRSGKYSLVGLNVVDKITMVGSKAEGADLKRDIGVWVRGIADKYGAVIGVLQADASAEGERWLNQSQLYGSKTGLQAESDVQIMIGKDANPSFSNQRFLGVVRNKLPGGPRTEPGLRHGQFAVAFNGEIGRFSTEAYK